RFSRDWSSDVCSSDLVDLFWIPLGAAGSGFVRFNGRVYERWAAVRQHRTPLHLFHTALRVTGPSGRFLIETMWPSPPGPPHTRRSEERRVGKGCGARC